MRMTTIFNGRGDLTLAWDEGDDETMEKFISDKMAQGWSFFSDRAEDGRNGRTE